jgi:hypothetical protein
MAGAVSVAAAAGGKKLRLKALEGFAWDADWLYFTVREPFPSKSSAATLVFGRVTRNDPLVVVSQTPEAGVIFSDGVEKDFLEFNSGARATITLAEKKGRLAV